MDLNFGGLRGRGVKKQDLPIERDLYLSLEDLFFGCTKKIKISRRVSTWLVPTGSHQLSPPTLTVTLTLETSGWSLMEFCNLRLRDLGLQNTRIWSLEGTSEAISLVLSSCGNSLCNISHWERPFPFSVQPHPHGL